MCAVCRDLCFAPSTLHKKGSSQEAARLGAKRRQGVCTPPCFLQLVLRLICLHPCKRADGLNVFQVYDISSSFNLKSLYLSFIQHSVRGVMLQSDVTRLTGALPLHIHECRLVSTVNTCVKLRNTYTHSCDNSSAHQRALCSFPARSTQTH